MKYDVFYVFVIAVLYTAYTLRDNNVIITSKWRCDLILTQ